MGVWLFSGNELTLAFGIIRVPLARDAKRVHSLEFALANGVADTLGVLFALVWTAGFLPRFLDPQAISVLLAKPTPRWCLLLGKYFGVLAFVLVQATLFVLGTWVAWAVLRSRTRPACCKLFPACSCTSRSFLDSPRSWPCAFAAPSSACLVRSRSGASAGLPTTAGTRWRPKYIAIRIRSSPEELTSLLEATYWILPKPADRKSFSPKPDAGEQFVQPRPTSACNRTATSILGYR